MSDTYFPYMAVVRAQNSITGDTHVAPAITFAKNAQDAMKNAERDVSMYMTLHSPPEHLGAWSFSVLAVGNLNDQLIVKLYQQYMGRLEAANDPLRVAKMEEFVPYNPSPRVSRN